MEEISNLRKEQKSSTRTTTTSDQFLNMLSRRTAVAVPNTDLLNDIECTTRRKKCCRKLASPNIKDIHPYLRDDTTTTSTEIRSQIGWAEQHIMLHDRITLENPSYIETKAERIRNSTRWILTLNRDGAP